MDLAGIPVLAETTSGVEHGAFPVHIAPDVPFTDVVGYRWQAGAGIDVRLRFSGDLFEMEDQRNWTDGSYKTYCTPSHLPIPVDIQAGGEVEQSVVLEVENFPRTRSRPVVVASPVTGRALVNVGPAASFPMPGLGLALAPGRERLDDAQVEAMWRLRLGHVRVVLELARPGWRAALDAATASVRRLGCALELEVVAGDEGQGLNALMGRLQKGSVPLTNLFVFPASDTVTTGQVIDEARRALEGAGVDVMLGGGSRANFAEFNMRAVPFERLDVAGFSMNPQVHASDDQSVMETIPTQSLVAANARRLCGDVPLALGPVTLRPRFDADARPLVAYERETESTRSDPRQTTAFAAAWTVGSLAALAKPGIRSLTYFEATGPAGVIQSIPRDLGTPRSPRPGPTLPPVYRVLEAIGELEGASAMDASEQADVAFLGLGHSGGLRLLLANLGQSVTRVRLRLTGSPSIAVDRIVGSVNAAWELDPDIEVHADPTASDGLVIDLSLAAYGVARVDGRP